MAYDSREASSDKAGKPAEESRSSSIRKGFTSLGKLDWPTFGALAIIVVLGAYLRFYFDFWQSINGGFPSLSGGSDADFYFNVISYALGTGHQMLFDPMLNYPIGSFNPFLPFYVWSVVLLSWPISFLFHIPVTGSIYAGQLTAGVVAYSSISALSGVGAIIATYYLGKELFSKQVGVIAAAFMAFLPSIVSESTAGFGVHDPFVLMLTAAVFFFVFRALNTINGTRWVERWQVKDGRMPDFESIGEGLSRYYRDNKTSLLYAAIAGVMLAGIANAWEGYSYILVTISLFYLVQSFVYKFKNKDTLALTAIYTVIGSILVLLAAPVYYNSNAIYPWYYVSVLFFIGTLIVGVIYTVARDIPWLTLISALVAGVLVVLGIAEIADPRVIHSITARILNAQSYFIKSAVYTTIAEAQSPPFSLLALSLGAAVFFLAFAEMAYMAYRSPKGVSNSQMMLMVWFLISAFMAVSTVRFVLDATTTFVLMAAQGLYALIVWTDFSEVRKGFQTYGSSLSGIRKSIRIKHVLVVIFVAFIVVMPVVWTGIDAATPSNQKNTLNNQIYDVLPSFLRPPGYTVNSTSSPYYFGAFGYSLETPSTYFPDAWSFINNRTSSITPYSNRPAYLSWWDYGSAVITFAQVPTVADDFQQGYQLASAFLFSQNQSQAISLLVARVMNGAYLTNGNSLPINISQTLEGYGINASYVQSVMKNPDNYKSLVLSNPSVYGPFASSVSGQNVMYAVLMVTISQIGLNNVVSLYQTVSKLTNNFIGYFSVDARLFPFSATNTGVFYAPAFLGGRNVLQPGVYNIPSDYYTITATTSTGVSYPIQSIPPGSQVLSYSINYQPLFYNMTMYRFFMGYSGYDITGQNISGLPGLSGNFLYSSQLRNLVPMPGWMESHFEMVYRTAYYNPYPLQYVKAHPNAWRAISLQQGLKLANADPTFSNYTVDLSPQSAYQNGIVVMEYYPGAYLNGTILLPNGQPAAGVRVTVLDQWGIPHDVAYTNSAGKYSAIGMQGNDTVIYSTGPLTDAVQNLTEVGTVLKETNITVSYSQAMRQPTLNATSGTPAYNINLGKLQLNATSVTGHIFFTTPSNTTYTPGVTPPVLNVGVKMVNTTTGLTYTTYETSGVYNISSVLPGMYNMYLTSGRSTILVQPNVSVSYGLTTPQDLAINPFYIVGSALTPNGQPVSGEGITLFGLENNLTASTVTAANGSYSFSTLLPGNYTIYLSSGPFTSSHYTIDAVALNYTQTHPGFNLTALENVTLSGTVTVDNTPAVHDTLYFYSQVGGIASFEATTDANGHYSLSLGAGNYTVYSVYYYGAQQTAVVLSNVSLQNQQSQANFTLTAAHTVSGSVRVPDGNYDPYANIAIQHGNSFLNFSANSTGLFSFMLPNGNYGVWVSSNNGAYLGQFTVNGGPTSLSVSESRVAIYSGRVQTVISGTAQAIPSATFSFTYGGFTFRSFTNLTGGFTVSLPGSYAAVARISSFGMITGNLTLTGTSKGYSPITLVAETVQMTGTLSSAQPLPSGIQLTLTANGTTLSLPVNSGGTFATPIKPGTYAVSLTGYNDSQVRYTLPGAEGNISIPVGSNYVFEPTVVPKYNTTIFFDYPASSGVPNSTALSRVDIFGGALSSPVAVDNFVNGQGLYLAPSSYTVYAYSSAGGRAYAFIDLINISSRTVLHINVTTVYNLTGTVYYGAQTLASALVYITASNGAKVQAAVQSDGSFAVSLPALQYTINATYASTINESGGIRYVSYAGQQTVNLTNSASISLQTIIYNDNSTVSGTAAWFYNLPVQSHIKFIAEGAGAMSAQTNTSGNGSYSISLAPGNYTVATYSADGLASNITQLSILQGQNNSFSPVLTFAYKVQGTVTAPGYGNVPANITFSGAAGQFQLAAADNGSYSAVLPQGNYSVTAYYNKTVDGTNYVYSYNSTVHVSAPASLSLSLSLLPTYSVSLKVLSSQGSQTASGFTNVSLLVNNTGDVPDIFYMSVDTANWYGSFNPTYVILGTGKDSSAVVNVTLSSSNPSGGYNNVLFSTSSIVSASAKSSVTSSIQVPSYYGFSTTFSSYGSETTGRTVTFSIVVNNTGNTASNFVASVSNLAGLSSEGWSGGIYTTSLGPFHNDTLFTLQPHQNQTLTISLTATVSNPSTLLPVGVNITQKETGSSYSMAVPISLPKPVVQLSGITVSGQGASAHPPPIISFKRGVIIFVLAALVIADVYYAKKRRLIR